VILDVKLELKIFQHRAIGQLSASLVTDFLASDVQIDALTLAN